MVLREWRVGFESGECKVAEGGVLSFNAFRGEEFVRGEFEPASFLWGGDPVQEVLKVLKGSESFQSSVHSGTRRWGDDRRVEAAAGVGGRRQGRAEGRESAGVGVGGRRDGAVRLAPGCVGDRNRPYGTGVP